MNSHNINETAPAVHTAARSYNAIDLARFVLSILVVAIHAAPFGNHDSGIFS